MYGKFLHFIQFYYKARFSRHFEASLPHLIGLLRISVPSVVPNGGQLEFQVVWISRISGFDVVDIK